MAAARLSASFIALWLLWPAGPVQAQEPIVMARELTMTAKVEHLNRANRLVTLRTSGNTTQTVRVDPSVREFDDLETGDVVTVRYIESVVVQVNRNAKLAEIHDTTEEARKSGDEGVIEQFKAVVTIESVDVEDLLVTFRTHDNVRVARTVTDKRVLEGVRSGDRVEITLTRARAVGIEKRRD